MGLELKGKVRIIDINVNVTFILMVFRAKRLDKINQGKTTDEREKDPELRALCYSKI